LATEPLFSTLLPHSLLSVKLQESFNASFSYPLGRPSPILLKLDDASASQALPLKERKMILYPNPNPTEQDIKNMKKQINQLRRPISRTWNSKRNPSRMHSGVTRRRRNPLFIKIEELFKERIDRLESRIEKLERSSPVEP